MNENLHRTDESKEFYTNERCHILEMLNNHNRDKNLSIAQARVEPGVTTAWHRLSDTTEYYYVISGEGFMEIDEDEGFEVKKSDIVSIPPGSAQRIQNTSEEDLVFLAICTPPFTDENYEDLE